MKILRFIIIYLVLDTLLFIIGSIFNFKTILLSILLLITLIVIAIFYKPRLDKANIDLMSGHQFEDYLENIFQSLNYKVHKTPMTNDQGADLILNKNGETTAVQAKRYSKPVGNKAVQEVIAAKQYYGCDKAIVVTNNNYTKSARKLAKRTNVSLWNGRFLKKIV